MVKQRNSGDRPAEEQAFETKSGDRVESRSGESREATAPGSADAHVSALAAGARAFADSGRIHEAVALYEFVLQSRAEQDPAQDSALLGVVVDYVCAVTDHAAAVSKQANLMDPDDEARTNMLLEAQQLVKRAREFLGVSGTPRPARIETNGSDTPPSCFVGKPVSKNL